MKEILLSIVIPIYNKEKYIEECVNSIVNNGKGVDNSLIEVICVDDGSTDSSLKILNEKAMQYGNVIVIAKENGGVSSARNAGLDRASGKYIWFVDADDYILPNVFERLLPVLEGDHEWITFDYVSDTSEIDIEKKPLDLIIKEDNTPDVSVWRNIVRLNIIKDNNIRFNKEMTYSQDVLFSLSVSAFINRITKIANALYFYRRNDASATYKARTNKKAGKRQFECIILQNKLLIKLTKKSIKNKHIKSTIVGVLLSNNKWVLSSAYLGDVQKEVYKKAYPLPLMIRLRYLRREMNMKKSDLIGMVFFPRMYLRRKIRKAKKVQD